ncbi:MAG: hypothetical protein ACJ764_14035 [Solirubrobacteraceae bacterium]
MTRRLMWITALLVLSASAGPAATSAEAADTQQLVSALQSQTVQSIGVPRSLFTALSRSQIKSLRAEIGRLDPGRIWILVVSPRSQAALGDLADPVFGDSPAGTLIAVAGDPQDPNTTHFWVGSSWEPTNAAETQLNNVINSYHKGQGSLFDDLRLAIQSFARGDAAAGHPPLSSGSNSSPPGATTPGGTGDIGLIVTVIIAVAVLLPFAVTGGRMLRRSLRASHWRREEAADAHEQAQADLSKLADQIEALDIDSQLPSASPAGKDEYAKALDCYEEAKRRMEKSDDEYQFEHALNAIKLGLEHVGAANRLFNPPQAQPSTVTERP